MRASHPEPAVAVTTVTALLAWGVGHDGAGIAKTAGAIFASQLAIGWVNDWLDADRDRAVGRVDKPVAAGAIDRRLIGRCGLAASVACVLVALSTGFPAALLMIAALVSALLYDWPLKLTPLSVLPYAVSFGLLPAFVVVALPGAPAPPAWLVLAGALLGAGAHFANALPDLDDDTRTGVRGLPQRLGSAGSRLAAAVLLLAATVALVVGPAGPPSWAGIAAVLVAAVVLPIGWYVGRAAAARGGRPVAMFQSVMAVAVIDVVLLVASGRVV
ncbi:membrane protein [Asanoa ferruginea]|nr:membrane protein [Asanoa ferruginea]